VLTVWVYDDAELDRAVELCDTTSPYALTGAIFARDRRVIVDLAGRLRHTAGNFYVNDKPTGAVVGQQPFGGGRASGTNDKAGSKLNLLRWVSQRAIKENFVPHTEHAYPHMREE
jgi:1-pyrroline-5-carboxylate dehydrogenase